MMKIFSATRGLQFVIILSVLFLGASALQAVTQGPTPESLSHFLKGLLYDWDGMTGLAINEYEQAARYDPDSFAIHLKLGADYARIGELEKAIKEIETAQSINPRYLHSYYLLAVLYSASQEYQKAAEQYEKILVTFSRDEEANLEVYAYLGQLYYSQQKYREALQQFQKILEWEPENKEVKFLIGSLYFDLEKKSRAIEIFKEVIKQDPSHQNSLNFLSYIYAEQGIHLDEALVMIQKALEIEPDNGAFLDTLGWIYYQKGLYEEALDPLEKAAEIYPDAVIFDHLGDAYLKMGLTEKAKKSWQRALQLAPEDSDVDEKINTLKNKHISQNR